MGLHWATEVDRPLPLAVVDGLRSSGRRVARAGRRLARTPRSSAAAQHNRARLVVRPAPVGVTSLRVAR